LFSESDLASSCVNKETITWRDANECKFGMIITTKGGGRLRFLGLCNEKSYADDTVHYFDETTTPFL
jgi:hypothetical protein